MNFQSSLKLIFKCSLVVGLIPLVTQGATWTQVRSWQGGVNGPSDREHPLIFITPNHPDELILHGGLDFGSPQEDLNDLWSMNLKNGKWRKLNQQGTSPGPMARVAIDEKNKTILATGGEASGLPSGSAYTFSYEKNVGTWNKVQTLMTLPRMLHALISIPGTSMFMAFGGVTVAQGQKTLNNLTSVINIQNNGAKQVMQESLFNAADAPSNRYGFVYAYDQPKNRIIVSVGQGSISQDEAGNVTSIQEDKTFSLDLTTELAAWKELTNAKLAARRNPCWALDKSRNQLYVFGGTTDGLTSIQGLEKLDLNQENPSWEKVDMSKSKSQPVSRSSCVAIYDQHRDRILLGFGNTLSDDHSTNLPMTDLWALNLR